MATSQASTVSFSRAGGNTDTVADHGYSEDRMPEECQNAEKWAEEKEEVFRKRSEQNKRRLSERSASRADSDPTADSWYPFFRNRAIVVGILSVLSMTPKTTEAGRTVRFISRLLLCVPLHTASLFTRYIGIRIPAPIVAAATEWAYN
jgi:hypothetical protein